MLASVYGFQAVHAHVIGMFTNTTPVDAYRGAGRPESNYLVQRLIDQAARELKVDRVELRRKNMVAPSQMPWKTAMDALYDSGDFATVLDAALAKMDWQGSRAGARRAPPRAGGAASAWPITWRPPAVPPASGRKSASPTMAASTCWSARNRPARARRPPT